MCFESSNNRYSRKVSCSFVFFKAELIQFDAYLLLSCGVFYTTMNVPGMVDTETHHKHVHWTCGISVKHDPSLCGIMQVFFTCPA